MDDWKDKYYASLESLEDKEKEWGEADQLLRRCISRMTLALDSKNKKLDEHLERLRNIVRREKNLERIRNMIDAIVEVSTEKQNKSETVSKKDLLNALLNTLPYPASLNKTKKDIKKRLDYMKDDSSLVDIFNSILALIESALNVEVVAGDEAKKESKGLLKGLFSSNKNKTESSDEKQNSTSAEVTEPVSQTVEDVMHIVKQVLSDLLMAVDVPVANADELDVLRQKTRRIETKKDLQGLLKGIAALASMKPLEKQKNTDGDAQEDESHDVPLPGEALEINEILIQLLERLVLPDDLIEYAEQLKSEWAKGIDEDHVAKALESIADLVIKMRARSENEKNDFQEFLQQVTEKLQMLDQHIQDNENIQNEIFSENQKFSDDVGGEVESIQTDVQEAVDLTDLKTSIAIKLSKITKHVDTFRTTEERRKLKMEIRVGELAGKVHSLESESEVLRERIVEEQKNSMLDALTKVPNRLAWDQRMDHEFSRWKRYQAPLLIVVWDIDDFKKVNDTYGHKAGDKVLVTIATLLKDQVRETDFIARFGGEEFVMLLPETELKNAQAVVEKLRKGVEECEFHHGDQRVSITVSGGMTQFKKGDTIESAFERADQFLYKAKGSGKNRCLSELD
ncbi:MAG: diguanylate cyclase [Sulfuriflexus sp.]|nr:diguanylate cyclase [Sulfuriflexus sp.]